MTLYDMLTDGIERNVFVSFNEYDEEYFNGSNQSLTDQMIIDVEGRFREYLKGFLNSKVPHKLSELYGPNFSGIVIDFLLTTPNHEKHISLDFYFNDTFISCVNIYYEVHRFSNGYSVVIFDEDLEGTIYNSIIGVRDDINNKLELFNNLLGG